MTQNLISVGIVGANAEKSWAKVSHVPAIKGLPGEAGSSPRKKGEESTFLPFGLKSEKGV